jgi:hypothetical protein
MNTMGKILVGLNLLISLVVSALIILVFVSKTNWKVYGEERERARAKEELSRISAEDRNKQLEATAATEKGTLKDERDDATKRMNLAIAEKTKAVGDLADAKKELTAAQNTLKQYQATIENREAEVKNLDARVSALIKTNNELIESTKDLAKKKIEFEIAYASAKERNDNLITQYQELLKQFEAYRLGDAARTRSLIRNPPPEDVKGSIKAVADKDGLVTINLGSDSGLSRDHTLEVYRLKPNPQYVGMVRILDVRPNEAVGKLTLRRGTVQVGDEVASEIISKR